MQNIQIVVLFFSLFQHIGNYEETNGSLSIVIDDLGYSHKDLQALSLPSSIAFSILPFTPQGKKIAKLAYQQGREILVHIPMQAKVNNHLLGEGALLSTMQEKEFKATLQRDLDYIPHAKGINNHMGSLLTEQSEPMRWTMEVLFERGLYFIDSRTSSNSVAETTANRLNVPVFRRHVFLDNIKTPEAMNKQYQVALKLSQTHQHVIVIAHPYPETLHFLNEKFKQRSLDNPLTALNVLMPTIQRSTMTLKKLAFQQANNLQLTNSISKSQ
jgi:polysaccharide deacetylase 2 family uncharacterized protein YibQ